MIRRTEKKVGMKGSLKATLEEAEVKVMEAEKKYWKDIKNAPLLRSTFLESKANEIELHKGKDASKVLIQLQQ